MVQKHLWFTLPSIIQVLHSWSGLKAGVKIDEAKKTRQKKRDTRAATGIKESVKILGATRAGKCNSRHSTISSK